MYVTAGAESVIPNAPRLPIASISRTCKNAREGGNSRSAELVAVRRWRHSRWYLEVNALVRGKGHPGLYANCRVSQCRVFPENVQIAFGPPLRVLYQSKNVPNSRVEFKDTRCGRQGFIEPPFVPFRCIRFWSMLIRWGSVPYRIVNIAPLTSRYRTF